MSDYHLHLYPHQPSPKVPPTGAYPLDHIERYIEVAAARGVTEVAFTEHLFRCVESAGVLGPFWNQEADPAIRERTEASVGADRILSLERYVDVVLRAKDAGLPALLGLEVDFFPETIDAVLEFLAPYPFDLLIGSVHWIGGWWFDRRHAFEEWERRGHRHVYEQYFALETLLAASGSVDVLAHIDRVKFLGHRLPEEPLELYETLVTAAAASGVAVELSSAGLRHPIEELYPAPTLLEMCCDAGLDITFGSDAHRPDQAGWRTEVLRDVAVEAGFTHTARFRARRRTLVPIEPTDSRPSN
ncbi:MAG: PHP domain-containing protein [Acidimicrobiia bacterium]